MANPNGSFRRNTRDTALYVTLTVALILIVLITAMALFFKVSEITVEGASKYTVQQIVDASGLELDSSIFFMDTGGAEVDIKTALPYVDGVKVERRLPGTVVIRVTESVPVGYVTAGEKAYIIDLNARILEETSVGSAAGVEVTGATPLSPQVGKTLSFGPEDSVRLDALVAMLTALNKDGKLDKTTKLDVSNLSAVSFEYNGYRVNFGTSGDLDTKLSKFNEFLSEYPDPGTGQALIYDEDTRSLYFRE